MTILIVIATVLFHGVACNVCGCWSGRIDCAFFFLLVAGVVGFRIVCAFRFRGIGRVGF